MSAIFGYYQRGGIEKEWAIPIMKKMNHWNADYEGIRYEKNSVLGHLSLFNTSKTETEKQPYFHQESNCAVTADATLYNSEELKRKLGLNVSKTYSDAELIILSYLKWGTDCPKYFNGDFAFAIRNIDQQEFFCARDHHGVKPFYYAYNPEHFAFASEIKGLLELPFISKEIDELWVADYLCRIWLDQESSLYKSIKRLEPAHSLLVTTKGIHKECYWNLELSRKTTLKSETEYVELFAEELERAVSRRLNSVYSISAELSGGLDSSAVAAIANQKLKPRTLDSYSFVLADRFKHTRGILDEREVIGNTEKYLGLKNHFYLTGEGHGLYEAFHWNNAIQDEPPKEMNCLFRDILYQKIQQRNSRVLLSGFGGDEMVSQQASGYLEQMFVEGLGKEVWGELKAISHLKNRSLARSLAGLLTKLALNNFPSTFKSKVYAPFNRENRDRKKLNFRPLQEELFRKHKMEERFEAYFKKYTRQGNFLEDQVRRMREPHVSYRLEYCDIAARSCKLEYRYPLLDVKLIEVYLSFPTQMKAKNGQGRYLFRKALEAHLPVEMVWRSTKKGSSNPQLMARSKIDADKITDQLHALPANHPFFKYADLAKRKGFKAKKEWRHETLDFMNLLLAHKLETKL